MRRIYNFIAIYYESIVGIIADKLTQLRTIKYCRKS